MVGSIISLIRIKHSKINSSKTLMNILMTIWVARCKVKEVSYRDLKKVLMNLNSLNHIANNLKTSQYFQT